jgi:hypothetical protein
VVSLTLASQPLSEGSTVRLGGSHACTRPDACYGPSPRALSSGAETSLYRWHVANDWRIWTRTKLDSMSTMTRLGVPGRARPASARTRLLAERMSRGEAQANIRLLVRERGGASKIY